MTTIAAIHQTRVLLGRGPTGTEATEAPPTSDIGDRPDYCGCCGREIVYQRGEKDLRWWCDDCEDHVLESGGMHERAWFAQHDTDCPFQV